jgi:hypothetical protein
MIFSSSLLAKWVLERENSYESYRSNFIQLWHDINWPEDANLVRQAVAKSLGVHAAHYRYQILDPKDPQLPTSLRDGKHENYPCVVLETTRRNDSEKQNAAQEHFDAIAERLKSGLPKRIEVIEGAAGASGIRYGEVPRELQRGYSNLQSWNFVFMIAPLLVVILSVPTRRSFSFILPFLAFGIVVGITYIPWPKPLAALPPSIEGLAPLPPLPMPEYDFSTTRDAMESMIKAAKKGDVDAFKRGISGNLLEMTLAGTSDFSEPMRDIARLCYGRQISQEGNVASVNMVNQATKAKTVMSLVREDGDWKLAPPERDVTAESPRAAMEEILRAAREKDTQALGKRLSRSLLATLDDKDALDKSTDKLASARVIGHRLLDPSNAEVTLESDDNPMKSTFSMVLEDGMWKLTEYVVQRN